MVAGRQYKTHDILSVEEQEHLGGVLVALFDKFAHQTV